VSREVTTVGNWAGCPSAPSRGTGLHLGPGERRPDCSEKRGHQAEYSFGWEGPGPWGRVWTHRYKVTRMAGVPTHCERCFADFKLESGGFLKRGVILGPTWPHVPSSPPWSSLQMTDTVSLDTWSRPP
jgi:hypothetical protein